MVISVAGNIDEEKVMNELETHFGGIPLGKRQPDCSVPVYHKSIYRKQKDVEQLHLNIAFNSIVADSKEKYPLTILNSVFGGSINSRLFQIVRETHGLTYSIYSYGSVYKTAGLFQIYGAMNPQQLKPVIDYTFEIIDDIKMHGLSSEEISMAKEQIKTELIMGNESAKNRMNSNGKSILFRDYITPLEEAIDKINKVTSEEITAFANKYLVREEASMSFVGNLKVGKLDLAKL